MLDGHRLTPDEGLAILRAADEELLDLLVAAYRVRHRWFGNRVDLNFLINAKSGLCGEDCGYCSQSRVSKAEIPRYNLVTAEQILDGARMAAERQAKTYCVVISGRRRAMQELDTLSQVVPQVKATYGLKICFSVGLLTLEQAAAAEGVRRRPDQSQPQHEPAILSAASAPRIPTRTGWTRSAPSARRGWKSARAESSAWARKTPTWWNWPCELGELQAEAVPVNFPLPIPGTPLEGVGRLNPRYCLKVLALFRLANPRCELRIAAGREMHLGPLQPLGLYPANSIFVGDYLTTKGQPPEEDYRMIEAMGFEVAKG